MPLRNRTSWNYSILGLVFLGFCCNNATACTPRQVDYSGLDHLDASNTPTLRQKIKQVLNEHYGVPGSGSQTGSYSYSAPARPSPSYNDWKAPTPSAFAYGKSPGSGSMSWKYRDYPRVNSLAGHELRSYPEEQPQSDYKWRSNGLDKDRLKSFVVINHDWRNNQLHQPNDWDNDGPREQEPEYNEPNWGGRGFDDFGAYSQLKPTVVDLKKLAMQKKVKASKKELQLYRKQLQELSEALLKDN